MNGSWVYPLALSDVMPFLIPLAFIACAFAAGITAMFLKSQGRDRAQRERMFLAEKGLEIPRELYEMREKKKPNGYRVARAWLLILGALLFFIGIGVIATLSVTGQPGESEWANGMIPLFIGVGFFAAERLIARLNPTPRDQ